MVEHILVQIYTENHTRLVRYCRSLLLYDPKYKDLAEEIVQEIFITAWEQRDTLSQHPNIVGWLMTCCKHRCQSVVRRELNRRDIVGQPVEYDEEVASTQQQDAIIRWLENMDAREQLAELQTLLTPLEQSVFDTYFVQGHTMKETASQLGRKMNTVSDAIRRIRKKALRMDWAILLTTGPAAFTLFCRLLEVGGVLS